MQVLSELHGGQVWRQKCPISESLGWGILLIPQPINLQSLRAYTYVLLNIYIDNWATEQLNRCYEGETEGRIQYSHLAWEMQQFQGFEIVLHSDLPIFCSSFNRKCSTLQFRTGPLYTTLYLQHSLKYTSLYWEKNISVFSTHSCRRVVHFFYIFHGSNAWALRVTGSGLEK